MCLALFNAVIASSPRSTSLGFPLFGVVITPLVADSADPDLPLHEIDVFPPPERQQLPQPQPRLDRYGDHRLPLFVRCVDQALSLPEVQIVEILLGHLQPLDLGQRLDHLPFLGDDEEPTEHGQMVVDRLLR